VSHRFLHREQGPSGRGPSPTPTIAPLRDGKTTGTSHSRRLRETRRRRRTRAPRSLARLATVRSKLRTSSTRTSKSSPPSTWPRARPPASKLASVRRCHRLTRSDFAVSHRLAGLRHPRFAGLLHPAADHGVHQVSRCVRRVPATSVPVLADAIPSRAFPSRGSRSHVTVGRSPSSFARLATPATSGLCSAGESVAQSARCRVGALVALLGFPPEAPRLRRDEFDDPPRGCPGRARFR
jgi:hypothetical protein